MEYVSRVIPGFFSFFSVKKVIVLDWLLPYVVHPWHDSYTVLKS